MHACQACGLFSGFWYVWKNYTFLVMHSFHTSTWWKQARSLPNMKINCCLLIIYTLWCLLMASKRTNTRSNKLFDFLKRYRISLKWAPIINRYINSQKLNLEQDFEKISKMNILIRILYLFLKYTLRCKVLARSWLKFLQDFRIFFLLDLII